MSIIGQAGCFHASRKELIPPLPRAAGLRASLGFPGWVRSCATGESPELPKPSSHCRCHPAGLATHPHFPRGGEARQGNKVSEGRCPSQHQRHQGESAPFPARRAEEAGDRITLSAASSRNVALEGVRAASCISKRWVMLLIHQRPSQTPGRPRPVTPVHQALSVRVHVFRRDFTVSLFTLL